MAFATESILNWLFDSPGLYVALIIVICTICLLLGTRNTLPPGPRPWPFLGTFPQVVKIGGDKIHLFYKYLHETYGPVATIYFGKYPLVLISGYDAVNDVFVNQRDVMIGRPDYIPGIKTTGHLRTGIPFGNGAPWVESRKTMLSAVSVVLKSPRHEDLVLEEVKKLVKDFTDKEGAVFQPREHLLVACFNWCLGSAFGKRFDRDDVFYQRYLNFFMDILHNDGAFSPFGTIPLLKYIPFINTSYKKRVAGYNGMDKFAISEVKDRKSCYDENRMESLLDVFIREQRQDPDSSTFSDDNIAVHLGDFIIFGAAVSYRLDWILLYMVAYPEIQEKCRQEIHQAYEGRSAEIALDPFPMRSLGYDRRKPMVCGKDGSVKFADTDKLPYVRATVYETQRVAAVVPGSVPYCALKDINVRGYTIPQGTMIAGHLASVHMDDTQWTEPDKFNPDRFLDGKVVKKPPCFMPFGNGPRFCPGYSIAEKGMIVVFANLLQSLEFRSSGEINMEGKYTTNVHPAKNEIIAKKST